MSESSGAMVAVSDLRKTYRRRRGQEDVTAVDGVSFSVRPGGITGLLGPNGAGKTTTIKSICGLVRPDSGSIRIRGTDALANRQLALASISAVLEGNRNLYWRLTARENLVYFAGNRGVRPAVSLPKANELLERLGLIDKADEQVNNLSRGMQQKLAIAVTLLADTEVVLLDEPTLGLDVEAGSEVRGILKEVAASGRTVIISTHDMPVVQDLCERVVIVNRGRVIADDRVSSLMGLFTTLAYRAQLSGPLSSVAEAALRQHYASLVLTDDRSELTVTLQVGEDLYGLVDSLRALEVPLAGLDRVAVDFEQVFRELVRNGSTTAPARPAKEAGNVFVV